MFYSVELSTELRVETLLILETKLRLVCLPARPQSNKTRHAHKQAHSLLAQHSKQETEFPNSDLDEKTDMLSVSKIQNNFFWSKLMKNFKFGNHI